MKPFWFERFTNNNNNFFSIYTKVIQNLYTRHKTMLSGIVDNISLLHFHLVQTPA